MRRFSPTALVVLPDLEVYNSKDLTDRTFYDRNILKVIGYLHDCGIELHFLASDTLFLKYRKEGKLPEMVDIYSSFCKEDINYIRNNGEGFELMPEGDLEEYASIYSKARKEVPIPRGCSIDNRFDYVLSRWKIITGDIVKAHKFVVTFEPLNKEETAKVKIGNPGDARLIWRIPYNNGFKLISHLSGVEFNMRTVIDYPRMYLPIERWDIKELLDLRRKV